MKAESPANKVHRALAAALAEIDQCLASGGSLLWLLSVSSELVAQIAKAAGGNISFEDVLAWLQGRATDHGQRDRLDKVVQYCTESGSLQKRITLARLLYRIVYHSISTAKVAAQENGNDRALRLVELFNSTPLVLAEILDGNANGERALANLRRRALEAGLGEWLDDVVSGDTASDYGHAS